jgi:hypothetical protein
MTTQIQGYPQTEFIDQSTKRPQRAWLQYFQNLLNFTSSGTATKGGAILPTAPAGFMNVTVNGKNYKVPYYNQ